MHNKVDVVHRHLPLLANKQLHFVACGICQVPPRTGSDLFMCLIISGWSRWKGRLMHQCICAGAHSPRPCHPLTVCCYGLQAWWRLDTACVHRPCLHKLATRRCVYHKVAVVKQVAAKIPLCCHRSCPIVQQVDRGAGRISYSQAPGVVEAQLRWCSALHRRRPGPQAVVPVASRVCPPQCHQAI